MSLSADNIREVTVAGVAHPIMGYVVKAQVALHQPEEQFLLVERLRKFCIDRMARYKVPIKFEIVTGDQQHSARFKKNRCSSSGN